MRQIKPKGLFWAHYALLDGEKVVQQETIPFATTLAVDITKRTGDDIRTGICAGPSTMHFNPPVYDKWHQVHYEYWRDLEYEPGKWYFDRMDLRIENLLNTGRIPILILYGTPDWQVKRYPVGKFEYSMRQGSPPDDIEAWKTFVRKLGERYKGKVHNYLVWSCEAFFLNSNFRGTTEQQVELARTAADFLHKIDPNSKVIAAMGGYDEHMIGMAKGTAGYIDEYCSSHYMLFNRKGAKPEYTWVKPRKILTQFNASTVACNMEFGVYALGPRGVKDDGYPMTAEEVKTSGVWEKMPQVYRNWGKPFPDWFTVPSRIFRGVVTGEAAGLKYNLVWSTGNVGSFSDLLYKHNTPSPASVAYANLSGLLAGTRYLQRINIGSLDLKAYLFKKGDQYLIATFTDEPTAPAYFELAGKDIRVIDMYGNDVEHKRFGPVLKVMLRPKKPLYITGITNVPTESKPLLNLADAGDVIPGMTCDLTVSLYNPMNKPLSGDVTIALPEVFKPLPPQNVKLDPKQSRDLTFKLPVPIDAVGIQKTVTTFKTDSDVLGVLTHKGEMSVSPAAAVNKLTQTPTIDGKLNDWPDVKTFPIHLDKAAQLLVGVPFGEVGFPRFDWNSVKDLSAHAIVAYDKDNLYIAVRVYDDKLENLWYRGKFPQQAYQGDSIEIFLDARTDKQGEPTFTGDCAHLIIVPPMPDYPARVFRIQKPHGTELPGMVIESQALDDGYAVEVKIPFDNYPELKVGPGLNIGFDLGVCDNDEFYKAKMKGAKSVAAMDRHAGVKQPGAVRQTHL